MRYKNQLEEYYDVLRKQKSINEIVEYILLNDKNIELSKGTLKNYLYQIKREHTEVITVDDKPDWKVINTQYVFEVKGVRKTFSIELIDNIFLYYSTRGYNFTRLKVQQRFNITPRTFRYIQNVFNLSKDCDTISPYTKLNTSLPELELLIQHRTNELLDSGEMTRQKYDDAVIRKYRRIIDKDNVHTSWTNEVISELLEEYPNITNLEITRDKNSDIDEVTAVIADIHAGGKAEKTLISAEWNTTKLIEMLHKVAIIINSYKAAKVNIVILGDLVETISGINHPDSWKGIEQGMYGANVIIETKEILIKELLNHIVNLKNIIATGGNHDRLQASNKLGDTGATDLIFHMIKERLALTKSNINVIYDPVLVRFKTKNFGIIGIHGDKGLHRRELSYIINKFAQDKSQYQFVVSGHLHSFFCKKDDDQEIGRRITVPSIVTGNNYSDIEIGRGSLSGLVTLKSNVFGGHEMTVHNI